MAQGFVLLLILLRLLRLLSLRIISFRHSVAIAINGNGYILAHPAILGALPREINIESLED